MLSEEEKKAINQLKADTSFYDYELKNGKYIYELFKIEVYKKDVDVLLNLIETQQKEIEELKKNYIRLQNTEAIQDIYIKKDKIKAKIEELEKEQKDNRKSLYNAVNNLNFKEIDKISNRICVNMTVRGILQSLFDKKED